MEIGCDWSICQSLSVLNELGTNGAECCCKVVNGRKGVSALKFLVNPRSLQLERARVLNEALLMLV